MNRVGVVLIAGFAAAAFAFVASRGITQNQPKEESLLSREQTELAPLAQADPAKEREEEALSDAVIVARRIQSREEPAGETAPSAPDSAAQLPGLAAPAPSENAWPAANASSAALTEAPSEPQADSVVEELSGTITHIDPGTRTVAIQPEIPVDGLQAQQGQPAEIMVDANAPVTHGAQNLSFWDLNVGDQVRIQTQDEAGRRTVQSITVYQRSITGS